MKGEHFFGAVDQIYPLSDLSLKFTLFVGYSQKKCGRILRNRSKGTKRFFLCEKLKLKTVENDGGKNGTPNMKLFLFFKLFIFAYSPSVFSLFVHFLYQRFFLFKKKQKLFFFWVDLKRRKKKGEKKRSFGFCHPK